MTANKSTRRPKQNGDSSCKTTINVVPLEKKKHSEVMRAAPRLPDGPMLRSAAAGSLLFFFFFSRQVMMREGLWPDSGAAAAAAVDGASWERGRI